MNPMVITSLLDVGAKLIDRLFPDKQAADEAKLKLLEMQQTGQLADLNAETQLALAQIEVNKVEAASTDLFRAGWRPAVGWVCVGGLGYQFILQPFLSFGLLLAGVETSLPDLDLESLIALLVGLLGLGTLRTREKLNGLK